MKLLYTTNYRDLYKVSLIKNNYVLIIPCLYVVCVELAQWQSALCSSNHN